MNIQRVGVIGAGTMGNGIAHVFARSGFHVVLCDVEQGFLDRALGTIAKNLDREVSKNKITIADKDSAMGRIQTVTDRGTLAECDLVVEAATEKFEIKTEIFRDLDRLDASGDHPGIEHVIHFDYQTWRCNEATGESDRDALLQSSTGDEVGGGDSRAGRHRRKLSQPCATYR